MSEQLNQLQDLEAQLREVNQEFARAARPLDRMTDLNNEQRQKIGAQLRVVLARWESVTQQISEVLGTGGAKGVSRPITTKADRDEKH
jgi:hypothetical protein